MERQKFTIIQSWALIDVIMEIAEEKCDLQFTDHSHFTEGFFNKELVIMRTIEEWQEAQVISDILRSLGTDVISEVSITTNFLNLVGYEAVFIHKVVGHKSLVGKLANFLNNWNRHRRLVNSEEYSGNDSEVRFVDPEVYAPCHHDISPEWGAPSVCEQLGIMPNNLRQKYRVF